MAFSKNIVSVFVLCAALAISFGQVQHGSGSTNQNGAHHNQIRIRRQVVDEAEQENTILQDLEPEDAAPENVEEENHAQENAGEEGEEEDDAATNNEEENVTEDVDGETEAVTYAFWTTCDFGIQPIKSCYDCNSLLICKRVGGLVKPCGNPNRPHCNNGFCSPLPSAECA